MGVNVGAVAGERTGGRQVQHTARAGAVSVCETARHSQAAVGQSYGCRNYTVQCRDVKTGIDRTVCVQPHQRGRGYAVDQIEAATHQQFAGTPIEQRSHAAGAACHRVETGHRRQIGVEQNQAMTVIDRLTHHIGKASKTAANDDVAVWPQRHGQHLGRFALEILGPLHGAMAVIDLDMRIVIGGVAVENDPRVPAANHNAVVRQRHDGIDRPEKQRNRPGIQTAVGAEASCVLTALIPQHAEVAANGNAAVGLHRHGLDGSIGSRRCKRGIHRTGGQQPDQAPMTGTVES
ncbi:hypothetical protein GALL_400250 [mine drainage metagenome]|uniref:Uncharacterized protein n=1 Tax=mine drainage metagenome TaxID=410659 RepID=A0A1J5QL86_9ZZZZ